MKNKPVIGIVVGSLLFVFCVALFAINLNSPDVNEVEARTPLNLALPEVEEVALPSDINVHAVGTTKVIRTNGKVVETTSSFEGDDVALRMMGVESAEEYVEREQERVKNLMDERMKKLQEEVDRRVQ